jgi:hypothetical protein
MRAKVGEQPSASVGCIGIEGRDGLEQIKRRRAPVLPEQALACATGLAGGCGRGRVVACHEVERRRLSRHQAAPELQRLGRLVALQCTLAGDDQRSCRQRRSFARAGDRIIGRFRLTARVRLDRDFAPVVRDPPGKGGCAGLLELKRNLDCGAPVARPLEQAQQRETRLGSKGSSFKRAIGRLGPVKQTGLHEVLGQRVLSADALALRQVGPVEQVLVDAHRALVFAPAPEQVAEREVKIGRVRVLLDRLDERVDRLVVLLVEQQVQALVVDLRRVLLLTPPLPHIHARAEPAQCECQRKSPEQPLQVKVHRAAGVAAAARWPRSSRGLEGADRGVAAMARQAPMPPPARHHREDPERAAERERGQHDDDHRGPPLLLEEPVDRRLFAVVQREREQREEHRRAHQPD